VTSAIIYSRLAPRALNLTSPKKSTNRATGTPGCFSGSAARILRNGANRVSLDSSASSPTAAFLAEIQSTPQKPTRTTTPFIFVANRTQIFGNHNHSFVKVSRILSLWRYLSALGGDSIAGGFGTVPAGASTGTQARE
jgi:hypothetical protein